MHVLNLLLALLFQAAASLGTNLSELEERHLELRRDFVSRIPKSSKNRYRSYTSPFRIKSKKTGKSLPVTIKLYEEDTRVKSKGTGKMPDRTTHVLLYDPDGVLIGSSGFTTSSSEDDIIVGQIMNTQPHLYSGVGSIASFECILLAIRSFLLSVHEDVDYPSFLFRNYNIKRLVNKYIRHAKPGSILLRSSFEAISFYPKVGFQLQSPDSIILSDPHFFPYQQFVEELDDLAQTVVDGKGNKLRILLQHVDYFLSAIPRLNVTWPVTGFVERFKAGNPTEKDFKIIQAYSSFYHTLFIEEDIEEDLYLDYLLFKQEHPGIVSLMDTAPFEMTAKDVLRQEEERAKNFGSRIGYHDHIRIIFTLNELDFLRIALNRLAMN